MKTEKKRRFCRFDLLLLLVVLVLGAVAWFLSGNSAADGQSMTAAQLLEDLQRSSERYTDQEELKKVEYYNIDYTVEITGSKSLTEELLPEAGTELFEVYSGGSAGILQSCTSTENADGTLDVVLTIRQYALFTKLQVTTPAGTQLRIGADMALQTDADHYIGTGTITWISH